MDGSSNSAYLLYVVGNFYWSSNLLAMPHTNNKEVRQKLIEVYYKDFNNYNDIDVKFEDIYNFLHQELQKARESERARIEDEFAKVAKYTQDFEPDAYGENPVNTSYYQLYEGQWEYIIKPKDQSELDQPIS